MIILETTPDDLVKLDPILKSNCFEHPNIKISVYKNRRGQYKGIFLWCKADLGVCRVKPMFCTGFNYELKQVDNFKILIEDEEEKAF